uniref:Uncharacterized protein n=1 Tax=Megaselia scalaris TaxID=36166 RepID=T1GKS7_MEGSC
MYGDGYGHHHHHHHRPRVEVDYNISLGGGYRPGYYPPAQTTVVYNQPAVVQPAGVYVPPVVAPSYPGTTVVTQTTAPAPGMIFCETRRRWVPSVEFG